MASGRTIFKGIVAAAALMALAPPSAQAQSATGAVTAGNVATASREVQPNGKTDAVNLNPNQPVTSTVNVAGSAGVGGAKASFSKSFDLKDLLRLAQKATGKPKAKSQPAMQVAQARPAAAVPSQPVHGVHKAALPRKAPQGEMSASASASFSPAAAVAAAAPPVSQTPRAVPASPPAPSPLLPVTGGAAALALLAGGGLAFGKSSVARAAARQALHRLRPPRVQVRGHLASSQTHPPEFEKHKPAIAFILRPGRAETHLTFLDSDTK